MSSREATWTQVRDRLEQTLALLNQEIRSYPTPIARCDEQLTDLLERRSKVVAALRRLDAQANPNSSSE